MVWTMIRTTVLLIALLTSNICISEIVYTNTRDTKIAGSWGFSGNDAILVRPAEVLFDLNHDGSSDVAFGHHFIAREHRLSRESVELLQTAEQSQHEALSILIDVRSLTLSAAEDGANDADALAATQARVDVGLDRIDRLASWTMYDGNSLLDGSASMTGIGSHPGVNVLHVADTAVEGTYSITATTAGERASFLTSADLTAAPLSQDETLTVNGVTIDLFANMTATQVKDRTNQYSDQTSIVAHVVQNGVDAGKLRMYSTAFGAAAQLNVISNVDGAIAGTTSIGTTLASQAGIDAVVEIGGQAFNGQGRTVVADSGPVRGLAISIDEDSKHDGDNSHLTVAGDLGTVTLVNNSLSFVLDPSKNENINVALRSIRPGSLGLTVTGNQFSNLAEIEVTSAEKAQDSLAVVDAAIDTVEAEIFHVESVLENYFLPFGEAFVEGESLGVVAIDDEGVDLHSTGQMIGPLSRFSDELLSVSALNFDGRKAGFMGVRLLADDRFHYGWIRTEIGEDETLIVRDFAFESNPDTGIRAGFVPEPSNELHTILFGCLVSVFGRRIRAK